MRSLQHPAHGVCSVHRAPESSLALVQGLVPHCEGTKQAFIVHPCASPSNSPGSPLLPFLYQALCMCCVCGARALQKVERCLWVRLCPCFGHTQSGEVGCGSRLCRARVTILFRALLLLRSSVKYLSLSSAPPTPRGRVLIPGMF